jgi:hypothetical protein
MDTVYMLAVIRQDPGPGHSMQQLHSRLKVFLRSFVKRVRVPGERTILAENEQRLNLSKYRTSVLSGCPQSGHGSSFTLRWL